MTGGIYEQIKDDLGYLQMDRAGEVFAVLGEQARTEGWSHVEFLARLIAEQADATTQPATHRTTQIRAVPVPQDHRRVRLRVPTDRRPQARR